MDHAETYTALNEIFRRTLDNPSITLTPSTTAQDVEGWDSLAHIMIVVQIEKRFAVKFQAAEMEELKSVGELVDVLSQKLP